MSNLHRRSFLKASTLTAVPALLSFKTSFAREVVNIDADNNLPEVSFSTDGIRWDTTAYLRKLQEINAASTIVMDQYGEGGVIDKLEEKFVSITGKEKALFMPTGTMANQFAIKVLSDENAKVFVQELSHVYRDEGDAAQLVHNKRLIPLAAGEPYFTAQQLQNAVEHHKEGEVFYSGVGAVSIELPVRRANNRVVPFDELKRISSYCRNNNIKLHLDGARILLASPWTGISIKEYAALFDTVYISLYKYLGASAGAVLCGSKEVIDKMLPLMKVHGGLMYRNWTNAAMALNQVDGFETKMKIARVRADELINLLNVLPQVEISPFKDGSHIFQLELKGVDEDKFAAALLKDGIRISRMKRFIVNESILLRDTGKIFTAFKNAAESAKV